MAVVAGAVTCRGWQLWTIADAVADALGAAEAALHLEQAPHGLDEWAERRLQEAIAAGLRERYAVAREVYYPSAMTAPRRCRPRCDLVLAPPRALVGSLPVDPGGSAAPVRWRSFVTKP